MILVNITQAQKQSTVLEQNILTSITDNTTQNLVSSNTTNTISRIKVWYSRSSHFDVVLNGWSSQEGTTQKYRRTSIYVPQNGYYIEVDTTTKGTNLTFTVTTTADTGVGSFLKAIENANANPGLDYINFDIGSGPQTLAPNFVFGLPLIVSPVVIDGTTQPGYAGTPIIELNGTNLGSEPGLVILAGNSTIRGLVINRCQQSAIQLANLGNNVIENNFIGTNIVGSDSLPNFGYGIHILNSSYNRIGDILSNARNIIAGNHFPHVMIEGQGSFGNTVLGNYIGTDWQGLNDLSGQTNGILITDGASINSIGGLQSGAGNLISGNDYPNIAIRYAGTSDNVVQGNLIGTTAQLGLTTMENGNGIYILGGASNNLIGHTTTAGRNIISGAIDYLPGLMIEGPTTTNNIVQGNIIGRPPSSEITYANQDGVVILQSPNNIIGGTQSGAVNWISGNRRNGIRIIGSASTGNRIEGNLIGNPFISTQFGLYPNLSSGINIIDAPGNVIGGALPQAGNTIAGNLGNGILVQRDTSTGNIISGNIIGTDNVGTTDRGNLGHGVFIIASNNTIGGNSSIDGNIIAYNHQIGVYDSTGNNNLIRHNSIFANHSMEIDLAPRGITPNDLQDADLGANNLQNFPILDSAFISQGLIRIRGRFDSKPGTTYTLDFFRSEKRDSTFFGGGETWIGSTTKTCDGVGHSDINETFLVAVGDSEFITATAIDPDGNTSEFSRALCMKDTDGDGILDCWETEGEGIDWNADGIIDLNLYAHGSRYDHKDVFVEVDYMDPYRPATSGFFQVYNAFASVSNAIVNNPDGIRGIKLHIELDPTETPVFARPWAPNPWPQFKEEKIIHFGTTLEQADPNWYNILEAKKLIYRYCIFADRFPYQQANGVIDYPSGLANVNPGKSGYDFFVSLGGFSPSQQGPSWQAGTFMHELGHTLGLQHGGGDDILYKPNYYSVMNYLFQLPRNLQPGTWRLGYSEAQLPDLNETHLDELNGLNPPAGVFPVVKIPYRSFDGSIGLALLKENTSVDWNGDGIVIGDSPDTVDVNYLYPASNVPSRGETLHGYADWSNLQYNFRNSIIPLTDRMEAMVHEMTQELYDYFLTLPDYGIESPFIYWSSDPSVNIQISTAEKQQGTPLIASDGEGGAYIAWSHNPGYPYQPGVWAQKVDAFGATQWINNGIPIAVGSESQTIMDIITDEQGNAIISWQKRRTGSYDVMVQKIDQFGQGQWTSSGISITAGVNDFYTPWPKLVSDSLGGVIIVWMEMHSGSGYIYAQRVGASGDIQWTPGGVLINNTANHPDEFKIAKDEDGGVIITWTDKRNGNDNQDIYAQKISTSGLLQWITNGVIICNEPSAQREPTIVSNGFGGVIFTWFDFRTGSNEIYAQQVESSGQTLWTVNGVPITSLAGVVKSNLRSVSDGSHGAIISWLDRRRTGNDYDSYIQRIDSEGFIRWTTNGVVISDTLNCDESIVMSDNNHGAVVVFVRHDVLAGTETDLFAQLIDSTGVTLWDRNGVPISLANGSQLSPSVTSDLSGGAIITWQDSRNVPLNSGIHHIYAQNITNQGMLGGGVTTGVNESTTSVVPTELSLQQNYPNPFNPSTTIRYELTQQLLITIKIFNILGQEVATLVNEEKPAGVYEVEFNASQLSSGIYFYKLKAGSPTGQVFTQTKKMSLIK